MFNSGFSGQPSRGWDSAPAGQRQETQGHAAGDREPELGTWPVGPTIRNVTPLPWQTDVHIDIQLK